MTSFLHADYLFKKIRRINAAIHFSIIYPVIILTCFTVFGPTGLLARQAADPAAFITTWRTTTASESIKIPVNPNTAGYSFTVEWGDGTANSVGQTSSVTHTYTSIGDHTVTITQDFPAIQFGGTESDDINDAKLIRVDQWGTQTWKGMDQAFEGCVNLTAVSGTDAPVFAVGSTIFKMFMGCTSFNSNLNSWNLTPVRETSYMFYNATSFNGNISAWDMSNVTNTQYMFANAYSFNQDISGWTFTMLTRMDHMFEAATNFNQDIGSWNVAGVQFINDAFDGAAKFDQNLGDWDISSVGDMTNILKQSGLSKSNYDATLIGWANKNVKDNITVGADGLKYCGGTAARLSLISNHSWTFVGDINDCTVAAQPDNNGILYVDNSITVSGDGSSWNNALKFLSDAFNASNTDMTIKEIHVAKGTYYPAGLQSDADRSRSFVVTRGNLRVMGGYPNGGGTRDLDNQPVILSGDINTAGDSTDNSWHVIVIAGVDPVSDSLIVDGFTISGGNANEFSNQTYNGQAVLGVYGGGLFCRGLGANTVVRNCIIENNTASSFAGGLFIYTASTQFSHITVQGNHAGTGGGVFVNQGSSAHLTDFTIINNISDGSGGGFFSQTSESLNDATVVMNSVISGNTAAAEGGGIANQGEGVHFYNLQITGNKADLGGGVSDDHGTCFYTNVTISGNKASTEGGGAYAEFGSPTYCNAIIYGNAAPTGKEISISSGSGDKFTIIYSNFPSEEGDLSIAGDFLNYSNLYSKPLFVQPIDPASAPIVGGNYALLQSSPAVDAGFNDSIPTTVAAVDVLGNPRIHALAQGGVVDLGAFESNFGIFVKPDASGILYVDSSMMTSGDGSSWLQALKYLSTATKYARGNTNIKEIHVAKGTYFPTGFKTDTSRLASFIIDRDGLKLLGGYPNGGGTRDFEANPTILSGNINSSSDSTDNSFRVVSIKSHAAVADSIIVDGFSVTGGYANGMAIDYEAYTNYTTGAGILIFGDLNAAAIIRNCKVIGNFALTGGNGMYVMGKNNPQSLIIPAPGIQNCLIKNNGAIADPSGNAFAFGGAIAGSLASPVISNCTIFNNNGVLGAAISGYQLADITVKNSIIAENTSTDFPVLVNFASSQTSFINCLIRDNVVLASTTTTNTPSGFLLNASDAKLRIINSTLVNNFAGPAPDNTNSLIANDPSSAVYATNSIVWGNPITFWQGDFATSHLSYSLIEGLPAVPADHLLDGTQSYDLFVDTANGNYSIKAGSIAVNAGLNDSISALSTKDLAGSLRIINQTVDLGAFEFQDGAMPVKMGPLRGETNGDQHGILSWTTYTESQNKGFEVQRSADGVHFVKRSFIPSKANGGNSQVETSYRYDAGRLIEPAYFRVEQIDVNGTSTFTNTVYLQGAQASSGLLVYPNPVHNELSIQAPVQLSLHPRILILDLNGRVLLRKKLTAAYSKVNVSGLAAGIYLLKYEDDQHHLAVRFVKK